MKTLKSIAAIAVLAAIAILPACTPGEAPPLLFGIEYQIKDTPVVVTVTPADKGGYAWDFYVKEGEISDWLVKQPDGSYLITTKSGTQIRVEKAPNGKPKITLVATGENAPIRVIPPNPVEPTK